MFCSPKTVVVEVDYKIQISLYHNIDFQINLHCNTIPGSNSYFQSTLTINLIYVVKYLTEPLSAPSHDKYDVTINIKEYASSFLAIN